MGDLAYVFHFQPSELMQLTPEQMLSWHAQAKRIINERSSN